MERQCAWCLRFMDRFGIPISAPRSKCYEASHGMCRACGALWLDQVLRDTDEQRVKQQKALLINEFKDNGFC